MLWTPSRPVQLSYWISWQSMPWQGLRLYQSLWKHCSWVLQCLIFLLVWFLSRYSGIACIPRHSFTSVYLISFIIQTALAHVSFFGVIASSVDGLLDVYLYLELKKNLHSAYFICILSSVFVICRDIVILFPRWSLVTSSIVLANKMKKAYVALVTPENYFLRISHGFHTFSSDAIG